MNLYAQAGVDTAAGDRAVELMKTAVSATHAPEVLGGVGGFAGMFDVSFLKNYKRPILATSTDGVGTKIEIARALDKHDTIGQDLVAMIVDDIVVVGAKPAFMTDYVACGHVEPTRIATIVGSIAAACLATGTSLVGGEVAEHPDVLAPDEYDLAGAAVGAVDYAERLDPARVQVGDVAIAMASSGLHSNGFSLVRKILADRNIALTDHLDDFDGSVGEALLTPTALYTSPVLALLADARTAGAVHMLSHITGGGIAANVARVLPTGTALSINRGTWSPQPVFRILADLAGIDLTDVESTWNVGLGMVALVAPSAADATITVLHEQGIAAWAVGEVEAVSAAAVAEGRRAAGPDAYVHGAKGVEAGAARLVGTYQH